MRFVPIKLSCSTEAELFRNLGYLIIVQKLLRDYCSNRHVKGVGPEGFAEDWFSNFMDLDGLVKDRVLSLFTCSRQTIGRNGN